MCSHRYLFTILESGNMFLNSLPAWSAVLKERLCSTRKPVKSSSAFTTFWSKCAVVELAPKLVNFLCCWAASTYHLCFEMPLCLLVSFSPPCATLKSLLNTGHKAKPLYLFPGFLSVFEFITTRVAEFPTIFLFLWRSWLWIVCNLLYNVLNFHGTYFTW